MLIQSNLLDKLILLPTLRYRNATSVKVSLETAVAPSSNSLVERALTLQSSILSSLSVLIAGLGGGSTVSARSRRANIALSQLISMLLGECNQFIAFGALRNLNAILISPIFDLTVAPGIQHCVGETLLGSICGSGSRCSGVLQVLSRQARIATDRSDELVPGARLWDRYSALIEELLELGLGPGLIEPIARVARGLLELFRDRLVVLSSGGQERVALTWLRSRYAMFVEEGFELGISPAVWSMLVYSSLKFGLRKGGPIENPILDTLIRLGCRVRCFSPVTLYLGYETVLVRLSSLLGFLAFGLEVGLKLGWLPITVWSGYFVLPVVLHQIL